MKNKELEKAQQALADALKEKPELIPYQREIDRRLSICSPEMRMTILQFMIADRLSVLGKELPKLPTAIRALVKERGDADDNKGS